MMQQHNEFKIRTNKYGQPDVDFYLANAHKARNEAIESMSRDLKAWLVKLLDHALFSHHGHGAAPSH